jgi:cell division protein ZapA
MNEKLEKQIKVNILGRDYSIKSDEEESYIYKVADYVNQKIGEMKDKGANNPINTLIYTAFTIADDYLKMKRKQDDFISRIESKITEFDGIAKEK